MGRHKKETVETADNSAVSTNNQRDGLSEIIAKNLDKEFKDTDKVAWFLTDPAQSPTDVVDWISTGNDLLDLAISNRPHGGLPVGKLVEFTGLEGTGKSLLAAHVIAETQKRGGVTVLIDTEFAISREFLTALGVNLNNMLYLNIEKAEEIFKAIENIIVSARNSSNDSTKLVTIVVDSMAGATTEIESESDYSKDGYATAKSIIMSKAMRKITGLIARQKILVVFTNQLRMKMNAPSFSDPFCVDPFTTKIKIRYKLCN